MVVKKRWFTQPKKFEVNSGAAKSLHACKMEFSLRIFSFFFRFRRVQRSSTWIPQTSIFGNIHSTDHFKSSRVLCESYKENIAKLFPTRYSQTK